uniref:Ig-like domain-containing protein n=1 Tax=Scleropages formosus TaxID=113540 RepID=A0A8C9SVN5_SCLFO
IERDTVTLHTGVTDVQKDSVILWYFRSGVDDLIAQFIKGETETDFDERFRDRLELDTQTGSLTIRNLNTSDSGVYRVHRVKGKPPVTEFQLVVYSKYRLPVSVASRKVQSSSCRLLCSVENDRDVTLSWTRGKEMLNQTSSPHLNTTLSLHLDIEEQDNDTYSCVSSNPVSEESLQVNSSFVLMYEFELHMCFYCIYLQIPFPEKLGHFLKNVTKTKNCNLFIHLNLYLTDKRTKKRFSVFSLMNLILFLNRNKFRN